MSSNSDRVSAHAPLLTVVTVVFNCRIEIGRTIDSVLAQDYPNVEYIVIDGGSWDGTLDILNSRVSEIDVLISERDAGIYDAMNKGVRLAKGEHLLFMNSGDVFYDNQAITNAVRFLNYDKEQVLFGRWIRKLGSGKSTICHPDLDRGLFNHQAVLYSKNIHTWHGNYLTIKGLTVADYLFFVTLFNLPRVECIAIHPTLAVIDVNGVSAGLQTVSQKFSIDFILGRISKIKLLLALLIHPVYFKIKTLLSQRT